MDASVQLWMTLRAPSVLGSCHQFGLLRLFFAAGLPRLDFSSLKLCI
jgi:hypothetical protein